MSLGEVDVDLLVACLTDDAQEEMEFILQPLQGIVIVEYTNKLKKAFSRAEKEDIWAILVVGDKELSTGQLTLKNQIDGEVIILPFDADEILDALVWITWTQGWERIHAATDWQSGRCSRR